MLLPLLAATAALLLALVALWALSIRLRDVSIVDVFWGLGFVLAAGVYRLLGPPAEARQVLMLVLVAAWGVRLAGYIGWRNHGKGEDKRYARMREGRGDGFVVWSLFGVFLLQGALVVVISLPHWAVQAASVTAGWRWTDGVGLALWTVGFLFESIGDFQLARFKADPGNRGKVMDSGLWRYTRHPNYFGDFCVWWGFWVISLGSPWGVFTVVSPIVMSTLLMRVSGVTLLEKDLAGRGEDYRRYQRVTSVFFPRPPRRE